MNFLSNEVIITIATAFIATIGAYFFGYRNAINARIWEIRRDSYGTILFELEKAEQICDEADVYIQENEERYFHSDTSNKHNEKIAEHLGSADNKFAANHLVFSKGFTDLYRKFKTELRSGDSDAMPDEDHEHFTRVLKQNRPKLSAQARRDVGNSKTWW